ncbi:MAG: AI-2E family transporter [Candidatus Nanohaloarchaea archaeon]|nr:AI-2E family transporter [Candidatus Nanohaloarchaea archaeon]
MLEGRFSSALVIVLLAGTIWMIWPVLGALLLGIFTAYVFRYVKSRLDRAFNSKRASTAVMILIIFAIALLLVLGSTASLSVLQKDYQAFLNTLSGSAKFLIELFDLPSSFSTVADSVINDIGAGLKNFAFSTIQDLPNLVVSSFIFITSAIYFYAQGNRVSNSVFYIADSIEGKSGEIVREAVRSIHDFFEAVFITRAVTAVVMFFLSSAGLYIMDVTFWWGWSILIALFGFLPIVGAYLVYVPLGLILMVDSFGTGLAVILYGILVISTLPHYFLRPYVSAMRADEHPLVLFLGFVAGPIVMGLKGVFIGPSILVLTKDIFVHLYSAEEE